ncbi:MAG: amino acid permease [Ferruginibacter sp.]
MPATTVLTRKINLWTTISIVAGSVIGSSIFMKPAIMAGQLGSPLLLLFVWIFAGVVSMMGAAINAEIGAMLPVTGGQYVFFQKMYGDFFAYLYGWACFAVINTASVASIAYIFSQYLQYFIELPHFSTVIEHSWQINMPFIGRLYPLENFGVKTVTIFIIMGLTWINGYSVKAGGTVQLVFSIIKVTSLLLMISLVFFSEKGSANNFIQNSSNLHLSGWALLGGMVAALSGAFAAYDGWNNIGFVAGEINNPKKNIPRGMFIGLGLCILLYVLTNQAYLYILPVDIMAKSSLVATDALQPILGNKGVSLIALLVMMSAFGATNGNILACARVSFAMAREGVFFKKIGNVHPKHATPFNALWLHGVWTSLFVLTGSFDMLTDLFVFITWIFYGFGAVGIFILRKKMPDAERPYKAWGYPVAPAIFVLFSAFYFVITLYTDIDNYITGKTHFISSVFGLVLTALGIPLYFYFKHHYRNRPGQQAEKY